MRNLELKKTHMFLQLRRPKTFQTPTAIHHFSHTTHAPNMASARACVFFKYLPALDFLDRIHVRMPLDHILFGFARFAHFDEKLEPKCYSHLVHSFLSPALVDDLDSDYRAPGARDTRQIHQAPSQVLLVKGALR